MTKLQQEYLNCKNVAIAWVDEQLWNRAVITLAKQLQPQGNKLLPETYVKAAKQARVRCPKCEGSGIYSWGKFAGTCYACNGEGTQGQKDFKRNKFYWDKRKAS